MTSVQCAEVVSRNPSVLASIKRVTDAGDGKWRPEVVPHITLEEMYLDDEIDVFDYLQVCDERCET